MIQKQSDKYNSPRFLFSDGQIVNNDFEWKLITLEFTRCQLDEFDYTGLTHLCVVHQSQLIASE